MPKEQSAAESNDCTTEYIENNCPQSLDIYAEGSKTPMVTHAAFVIAELKFSKGFGLSAHVSLLKCKMLKSENRYQRQVYSQYNSIISVGHFIQYINMHNVISKTFRNIIFVFKYIKVSL